MKNSKGNFANARIKTLVAVLALFLSLFGDMEAKAIKSLISHSQSTTEFNFVMHNDAITATNTASAYQSAYHGGGTGDDPIQKILTKYNIPNLEALGIATSNEVLKLLYMETTRARDFPNTPTEKDKEDLTDFLDLLWSIGMGKDGNNKIDLEKTTEADIIAEKRNRLKALEAENAALDAENAAIKAEIDTIKAKTDAINSFLGKKK